MSQIVYVDGSSIPYLLVQTYPTYQISYPIFHSPVLYQPYLYTSSYPVLQSNLQENTSLSPKPLLNFYKDVSLTEPAQLNFRENAFSSQLNFQEDASLSSVAQLNFQKRKSSKLQENKSTSSKTQLKLQETKSVSSKVQLNTHKGKSVSSKAQSKLQKYKSQANTTEGKLLTNSTIKKEKCDKVETPLYNQVQFLLERKNKISKIARAMGYYGRLDDWTSPLRRITMLCSTNKMRIIRDGWLLLPISSYERWISKYSFFKTKGKCLKCDIFLDLGFPKVYCESCHLDVRNDLCCQVQNIPMNRNILNRIKPFFNFLSDIPLTTGFFGACCKCNKRVFCVWFHGYRSVCIKCVIKTHNRMYPNGKYLDCNEDNLKVILESYMHD